MWLVYCPHCGKAATGAVAPRAIGYEPRVSCVLCNRTINAAKGAFQYHKTNITETKRDLLSVE